MPWITILTSFLKTRIGQWLLYGVLAGLLFGLGYLWYSSQLSAAYKRGYDAAVIEQQKQTLQAQKSLNQYLTEERGKISESLDSIMGTTTKTLREVRNADVHCDPIAPAKLRMLRDQVDSGNAALSVH